MDDTYSLPSCKEDNVVGQVILQIIQMIHMDKFGEKRSIRNSIFLQRVQRERGNSKAH